MLEQEAHWQGEQLILKVYIQPKANHDEICGWHEKGLKVRISAPPVDGAANKQLLKFMAKQFKVAPSQITLLKGKTSRCKTLAIFKPALIPELIAKTLP